MWGVLNVLRRAKLPLVVHLDNVTAVNQYARGRTWCINRRRKAADLWKDIWGELDRLGDPEGRGC